MRFTRTLLSGVAAMALLAGPALAQPAPGQYQHNDVHGQMGPGGQDHGPQQYQQDHGPQQYQQDHGPQQYQQDHGPQQYQQDHGPQQYQQDHGPQQYQQDHGPQQYQQDHGPQQYQQDHGPQQYHDSQRGPIGPGNMGHQDYHGGDSGWGHDNRRWSRGEHYDGQRYVVHHDDWDRYHLHAPPPGYEWVRSGDQFIMIAIASGIIASIIVGSAYGN